MVYAIEGYEVKVLGSRHSYKPAFLERLAEDIAKSEGTELGFCDLGDNPVVIQGDGYMFRNGNSAGRRFGVFRRDLGKGQDGVWYTREPFDGLSGDDIEAGHAQAIKNRMGGFDYLEAKGTESETEITEEVGRNLERGPYTEILLIRNRGAEVLVQRSVNLSGVKTCKVSYRTPKPTDATDRLRNLWEVGEGGLVSRFVGYLIRYKGAVVDLEVGQDEMADFGNLIRAITG